MTVATWVGPGGTGSRPTSGDASVASAWASGLVPAGQDVVLPTGRYVVSDEIDGWSVATLSIGAGATLAAHRDLTLGLFRSGVSTIDGTLLLDHATLPLSGTFSGSGTIAGSGLLLGGLRSPSGPATVNVRADGVLVLGTETANRSLDVYSILAGHLTGAGELVFKNAQVSFAAPHVDVATLSIVNSDLQLQSTFVDNGAFRLNSGQIHLTGHAMILAGSTTLAGGVFDGVSASGATSVLSLRGSTDITGRVSIAYDVTVRNTGQVTQSGSMLLFSAQGSTAHVTNSENATWHLTGDSSISLSAGMTGVMTNLGTMDKTGSGNSAIDPVLKNLGTITAGSGTLEFKGLVFGTGTIEVSGGATLLFDDAVRSTQTVSFVGSNNTVALSDGEQFRATIAGFASSDGIDLSGFAAAGSKLTLKQDADGNGSTLRVASSDHVALLHFEGHYSGAGFGLSTDASGTGAMLTYGTSNLLAHR